MKTFSDDHWDREVELFSPFRTLWETENDEWVAARKQAWESAHVNQDGDDWTLAYGKFYVYGEDPPRCFVDDGGHETKSGFELEHRIAYTPFATRDDLLRFWEVAQSRYPAGVARDHEKFLNIGDMLDEFSERDEKVRLVTETMFSPELFMCMAESAKGKPQKLTTINPRSFAVRYSWLSQFYHENNRHECDYRNFSHEYFLLCVRYCEANSEKISPVMLKDLDKMYDLLIALDDSKLSPYRLDLKQKLVSAAEGDDAPRPLNGALKKAQTSETRWSFYDGHKPYLQDSRVKTRPRLKKPNLPG